MEQWKVIERYPNYEISNRGNIRNTETRCILKPKANKYGYCQVTLCDNGKRKTVNIHRIVAKAFLPNKENKPQVNHINGNKADNSIENLEWVTASENHLHSHRVLGKRHGGGQPKKKVMCIETGCEYSSITEAAKAIGGDKINLSAALRGKSKTHKGFHWKYLD